LGVSGGGFESNSVAEGFELADVVALLAFWVGTGVVVTGAEVVEVWSSLGGVADNAVGAVGKWSARAPGVAP
jgi:hypothetical protein